MDCITTYKQAHRLLLDFEHDENVNILGHIKHVTEIWCNSHSFTSDESVTRKDLEELIKIFEQKLPENLRNDDVFSAIETLVFCETYDLIMQGLKEKHKEIDEYLAEKCAFFNRENISAEHFGGKNDLIGPFTAAIVELSVIDMFHSPKDKLICLSTTYDLIFAELKALLVNVISKYSSNETEIPIVNNNDILPLLMVVIVKSKLTNFYSNLEYIRLFSKDFNEEVGKIFTTFEEAVTKLINCSEESLINMNCDKVYKDLDLKQIMELTVKDDPSSDTGADDRFLNEYVEKNKNLDDNKKSSCNIVLQEQNDYILNLITFAGNYS